MRFFSYFCSADGIGPAADGPATCRGGSPLRWWDPFTIIETEGEEALGQDAGFGPSWPEADRPKETDADGETDEALPRIQSMDMPITTMSLPMGSSTITYTAPDGRTVSVTIIIQAAPSTDTSIAQTGDNSFAPAYMAVAILAAALAGGLVLLKKRKDFPIP